MARTSTGGSKMRHAKARKANFRERALKGWRTRRRKQKAGKR